MFSELVERSNAVWLYSTGRFAEERRRLLCDLVKRGRSGWYMPALNHGAVEQAAYARRQECP